MRLDLKIIRKKFFKILLSMTIIISLGVALLFGLMNGVFSLNKSVNNFIEENNYPNIKITTELEDIGNVKKLDQKEIKNIEYRLSMSTIIYKNEDILSVKLSTYDDKDLKNFYIYKSEENNSDYYDIFVERGFSSNNNIKLGDTLKVKLGDKLYDFYVSKIISIPEALVSIPVNGFWGEINNYGNIYINRKVLYEETNKIKRELLNEILEKEEEILNEETNRQEEYNNAKKKIEESLAEYNNQKNYYGKIKSNLKNKKVDLNSNKKLLKELKKVYNNITNSIDKYENIIYSYIDKYSDQIDNTKEYIEKTIEEKYPNINEEELEFIINIAYNIIQGKVDGLIDSNRENIQELIHKIMDDNIKLDKLKPYYGEITQVINESKDKLKNTIEKIYNGNKMDIEKFKLITSEVFNYASNVIDEGVLKVLSENKDTKKSKPLSIIDELISEIDNTIVSINNNVKNIDNKLNKAFALINNNRTLIDENYKTFQDEISKAKQELNDKKIEINEINGYENKFNEILVSLNNDDKKEKVLENIIDKYRDNIKILDSYTYENSPVYNYITMNIDVMKNLSLIVPVIFYIIILIVLFLFVSLMIKQSKKEISILRLLGKSNNSIRYGYCVNNLIVAIVGIILGIIIGFLPMIYMVEYFKNFFLLPSVIYEVDFSSILLCTIITIVVVEVATFLATMELDKITPVEILKREVYQNKDISKFARIITSIFKPFGKFNFLVCIRNKSKLVLGIICTSMTVAMFFSSLAYIASKDMIFNNYFDNQIHYDAQVFKNGEITKEDVDELRRQYYVKDAELLRYFNVKVKNNDKEQDIVINALNNTNSYIKIFDKNNREIKYPEEGIVLEEHIAKNLGLKINDKIIIDGIDFKIIDISFQSIGRVNYISLADSYKLKTTFDTIVLNMDTDKQNELISKVSEDDDYVYTIFNDELREYNKKIFDSYTLPSIIIIIFTLIIGFIIVININLYNLLNQKKNLSIFRSLGFGYNEISRYWFMQSLIQWIISVIIGIPSGILLSKYFLHAVSSPRREFIYASGFKEYVITILLLLLYIYIGHRKTMNIFRKMEIVEEVKDRD